MFDSLEMNWIVLSFETGITLTIIVTLAKQLQETEEVAGELIICHHFLI